MDFDERMEMWVNKYLCTSQQEEEEEDTMMSSYGDTFAQRAEWYYHRLPQLLSLLQDLYHAYTTLLHRCNRLQPAPNNHYSSPPTPTTLPLLAIYNWDGTGSTLSQPKFFDKEILVAEVVIINVENDILQRQLGEAEMAEKQRGEESSRKIDLLKKLLEVLESERVVVLNENMRLGYKVQALREENKGLSSEAMFLKRKAAELARCVLKMREDHRACMLSSRIEDLQGQIHALEKRSKEYHYHYHQRQMFLEEEKEEYCRFRSRSRSKEKKQSGGQQVPNLFASCFQLDKITKLKKKKKKECASNGKSLIGAKRMQMWWKMVKNMDLGIACGLHH